MEASLPPSALLLVVFKVIFLIFLIKFTVKLVFYNYNAWKGYWQRQTAFENSAVIFENGPGGGLLCQPPLCLRRHRGEGGAFMPYWGGVISTFGFMDFFTSM